MFHQSAGRITAHISAFNIEVRFRFPSQRQHFEQGRLRSLYRTVTSPTVISDRLSGLPKKASIHLNQVIKISRTDFLDRDPFKEAPTLTPTPRHCENDDDGRADQHRPPPVTAAEPTRAAGGKENQGGNQ